MRMLRRFNESAVDEIKSILDELKINKDDVKITEKDGNVTVNYNGDGFILEEGDKVSDYKKDIIAILKKQKKESLRRKDEFLKGLVGSVNMTDVDWKKLMTELKSAFPKLELKPTRFGLEGKGITSDVKKVEIRIGEGSNKIYVKCTIGSKKEETAGLRPSGVKDALKKFLKGVTLANNQEDAEADFYNRNRR